ncbi:MAG: glycosyltransferase [Bacteroidales bacterium]|jgi:glycosyltransferase involved in cell wall biosynthesis|nr:glycosyltransferase family 2 protein [Bacteroidales bacterium]NLK80375.1 glycosyltransferase [Bacteroidales bacterium]HKM31350.1 glycosyltransferase family 2 protein [Bacteroidales bacterium]
MVSVILSTYNQPGSLQLVLWGYETQTYKNFELLVANDGSGSETSDVVEQMQKKVSYPLIHVFHEDKGFRKCTILNKALARSRGRYLVFSDGDIIPRSDFLEMHIRMREEGRFLSGGTVRLPEGFLGKINKQEIEEGVCFNRKWLEGNGLKKSYKNGKLSVCGWQARLMNSITPAKATWNGGNASGWRKDLVATGGFDERLQYGGEDRELGERLERMGIRGKQVRYTAITLHLDHPRNYVSVAGLQYNRRIRKENKRNKITRTAYGLTTGVWKTELYNTTR